MRSIGLALLLVVTSCSASGRTTTPPDLLGLRSDLPGQSTDLAGPAVDFSNLPPGCPSTAHPAQFATTHIEAPCTATDFTYDFLGDGTAVNAFGKAVATLLSTSPAATGGLCPDGKTHSSVQTSLDSGVSTGNGDFLFTLRSADATYQTDSCAQLQFDPGTMSGGAYHAVGTSAHFIGQLAGGAYDSTASTAGDVQVQILLPLVPSAAPTAVTLHGSHTTLTPEASNPYNGQLNGAISQHDLTAVVFPALGVAFTMTLNDPATTGTNKALISALIDVGSGSNPADPSCKAGSNGCKNADGSCSYSGDGVIGGCEIANSPVGSAFKPDIQLFAADGVTYKPSVANKAPNAFSVGLSFELTSASY